MPDPLAKSFYRRFREARTGLLRRLIPWGFGALLMLSLSGASALLLMRGRESIVNYRTPLAKYPRLGEATPPIVSQVVLIIVDGLREDAVPDMPNMQKLRLQGASATSIVPWSMSHPAWTTIVTGAEPELNDSALTNSKVEQAHIPETLFVSAKRAELTVAIAARAGWKPMVSSVRLDEAFFSADEDIAVSDHRNADAAISFLNHFSPNFLLVYFAMPDLAAHQHGATSDAYRQAIWHTDQLIGQIAAQMDLKQATLVITADHGHLDRGGHGGSEAVVVQTPLIATGARIKPGAYGRVRQSDIAPTLAALIGSPIPSASQGAVLFPMLELNEMQRATKALALANQQREFGATYLATIGGELSEAAQKDIDVVKSSMEVKNYRGAFTLSDLTAQQVRQDVSTARNTRIERERLTRAPIAFLMVAVPLLLFWLRRSLRLVVTGVMAFGVVVLQHALYLDANRYYSLSDVGSQNAFINLLGEHITLALLFGSALALIYHRRSENVSRTQIAVTFWWMCCLAMFLHSLFFAFGFYVNGLEAQWYLGDVSWAFWQLFSLTSITLIGLLSVPGAVAVALVYWLALVILHRCLWLIAFIRRLIARRRQMNRKPLSDHEEQGMEIERQMPVMGEPQPVINIQPSATSRQNQSSTSDP